MGCFQVLHMIVPLFVWYVSGQSTEKSKIGEGVLAQILHPKTLFARLDKIVEEDLEDEELSLDSWDVVPREMEDGPTGDALKSVVLSSDNQSDDDEFPVKSYDRNAKSRKAIRRKPQVEPTDPSHRDTHFHFAKIESLSDADAGYGNEVFLKYLVPSGNVEIPRKTNFVSTTTPWTIL